MAGVIKHCSARVVAYLPGSHSVHSRGSAALWPVYWNSLLKNICVTKVSSLTHVATTDAAAEQSQLYCLILSHTHMADVHLQNIACTRSRHHECTKPCNLSMDPSTRPTVCSMDNMEELSRATITNKKGSIEEQPGRDEKGKIRLQTSERRRTRLLLLKLLHIAQVLHLLIADEEREPVCNGQAGVGQLGHVPGVEKVRGREAEVDVDCLAVLAVLGSQQGGY